MEFQTFLPHCLKNQYPSHLIAMASYHPLIVGSEVKGQIVMQETHLRQFQNIHPHQKTEEICLQEVPYGIGKERRQIGMG